MLELRNQDLRVIVAPSCGGGVSVFEGYGQDIFRRAGQPALDLRDPLGLACFPMVPYVNRIAHGVFSYRGETVTVPSPWAPHALHGFGWRTSWQIVWQTGQSALLSFGAERGSWSWRYRCEQLYALEGNALVVELAVWNLDDRPMPASLGLHPYFPGAGEAVLWARSDGVWLTDEQLIPVDWKAIEEAPVSFADPTRIAGTDLDNCYTGFDGAARIVWPRRKIAVALEAPDCRFMQVYTRGQDGTFCVEAQTSMPDAMNHRASEDGQATGLQTLLPGERMACLTRFAVSRF